MPRARMLRGPLRLEGNQAGRKRIASLMAKMGIRALDRKPNTSKEDPGHKIYSFLLRNLTIDRPNQIWAAAITHIPKRQAFVYLVAVVDWSSRQVPSWRASNTLTTDFCLDAVRQTIDHSSMGEIFHTDHGGQFTSTDFTAPFKGHGIRISMNGKSFGRDNVFVERPWRSAKYEAVYL